VRIHANFSEAVARARLELINRSHQVHSANWQGVDVSQKPEAQMHELLNWAFQIPLNGNESLSHWRQDICPNIPWADKHFEERVGRNPLNPGEQWKNWPWGNSADKFRTQEGGRFDHTYSERFWPRYAGITPGGIIDGHGGGPRLIGNEPPLKGIRFRYSDLDDLVGHLAVDPLSRQAYLPIWFPEDGSPEARRKPCTLGYWFIMRGGFLHIHYPIRSCDIVRHFQDDCYMAVRLMLWILDRLRERETSGRGNVWKNVKPGMYSMWIGSFHCFVNDLRKLKTPV